MAPARVRNGVALEVSSGGIFTVSLDETIDADLGELEGKESTCFCR